MHMKRVIPCLDVRDGRVVKGVNFVELRDAGDPVELAARYDAEGADELVFLDITASHERREIIADLAARCAEQVFIPFTIGGGLGSEDDVRMILAAGADKVTMNTAAVRGPRAGAPLRRALRGAVHRRRHRRQARGGERGGGPAAALGGLRARRPHAHRASTRWRGPCAPPSSAPGSSCSPAWTATARCDGYDLELTRAVARAVDVPVIASGGVGTLEHLADGLIEGEADAVLAASIFHFGTYSIAETKAYLAARGIPVRVVAEAPTGAGAGRRGRPGGRVTGADAVARPCASISPLSARPPRRPGGSHRARASSAFPTDTVYGVGGALTPAVADALVAAKGRDPGKPLQVIFPTRRGCSRPPWRLAPELRAACRRLLPGPVTLLLPYPAGWDFPPPGTAGEAFGRPAVPTLGVRVPAWPRGGARPRGPAVPAGRLQRQPERRAAAGRSLTTVDAVRCWRSATWLWTPARVSGRRLDRRRLEPRTRETGRWRVLRAGRHGATAEIAAPALPRRPPRGPAPSRGSRPSRTDRIGRPERVPRPAPAARRADDRRNHRAKGSSP